MNERVNLEGLMCPLLRNGGKISDTIAILHLPALPPIGGIVLVNEAPKPVAYKVLSVILIGINLSPEKLAAMEERVEAGAPKFITMEKSAFLVVEPYDIEGLLD